MQSTRLNEMLVAAAHLPLLHRHDFFNVTGYTIYREDGSTFVISVPATDAPEPDFFWKHRDGVTVFLIADEVWMRIGEEAPDIVMLATMLGLKFNGSLMVPSAHELQVSMQADQSRYFANFRDAATMRM